MEKREILDYGIMSLDVLEKLVKMALSCKDSSCVFAFQGGEPTLAGMDFYKKLLGFQKKYNSGRTAILNTVQTNGYGLTEEWADFFAENHFLVGLSVDGIKYTHDAYRIDGSGKGSFAAVMQTVELFDKKKVDYNILTVVNRRTAERIDKIYQFYKKNNWKYQQYIACLDPLGEPAGQREYSLTPELYGEFLTRLFDLWFLDLQQGKQPFIRQFENYINILLGNLPESCEQRGNCSIQFVVEADGSVFPCDFYVSDTYQIGNVLEDSIEEIWERGKSSGFVEASLHMPEECRSCEYAYLCRGGCRRNRETDAAGTIGKNYFCAAYKYFFQKELLRLKQIAERLRN